MKAIRNGLSDALGRRLSLADMAKLCGLKDYARHPDGRQGNGYATYYKWEHGDGPSGPVAVLLSLYADALPCDWEIREFMLQIIRERLAS